MSNLENIKKLMTSSSPDIQRELLPKLVDYAAKQQARIEELEDQNLRFVDEAIAAVRGEYLEEPQNEEDLAYQRALDDAEQAIRALIKETGDE